ncbi:MAG: hypothetical protein PHS14_14335 [Elusimicrobia bacterium]|nr:hypothetical protein [Elusimicrobiota bacterium]
MKTPSSLPLLVFLAALPAAAQIVVVTSKSVAAPAAARCDTAFLEKVVNDFKVGGTVSDDRIGTKAANGVTFPALKFNEAKTCDAGTWRYLASGTPLVWRSADAGKFWDAGNAGPNAALVLVADDFFRAFDPAALKVLAAADAVIEAGVQLGVVTAADAAKPLSELLKGASGGPFGALKPKTVTAVEAAKQKANLPPEQLGPTLRKLLDETGAAKGGGAAVMDFRLAVLALNAELGRLGATNAAVVKRAGAGLPAVKDFMPGLPQGYVLPKVEKASALDDVKFGAALAALIGAGVTPALDDAAPRAGSLLEPVDLGLRNLIAIRAAQVEQIVALAKPRLAGKTITQLEVAARTAGEAGKQPASSLSAAVVQRLAESPEYQALDSLYENNKRERGEEWTKRPEAQAMLQAREAMLEAARSAKVETTPDGKVVVFTQGKKKIALTSVVPSSVENNAGTRNDVAGMISRFIVDGAKNDASTQAALAVIGGASKVGEPLDTNLTAEEGKIAKTVPPAIKTIKDGAAGCDNPKDLARNDYETYAARQRAAAAAMAGGNVRDRNQIEKTKEAALAASVVECDKRKAAAAVKKGADDFDGADVVASLRAAALVDAEAWCKADKEKIEGDATAAAKTLAEAESGPRNPKALRDKADADLAASFGVAVSASVETLRKDYTNPAGGPRVKKLIADAGLSGMSPRLTALTTLWFSQNWPPDEARKADFMKAVTDCAEKLGFKPGSDKASYQNPENPDNVAKACGVQAGLTEYISTSKGGIHLQPAQKQP